MIKNAVRDLLKSKGMTQIDLANKLDVKQETVSRTLSGNPTLKTVNDIANALDVEIKDLFTSDKINGFIEYDGKIHRIQSKKDLEHLLSIIP